MPCLRKRSETALRPSVSNRFRYLQLLLTNTSDDSLEWEEIVPWLKQNTTMEIWLKGITSPKDIELAIKHGIDGVVISNHGGRQLDSMPATLDVLEECTNVSQGRIPLAIDGGIRRGSDIFKALALGAKHCFIGRIAIWGLAVTFLPPCSLFLRDANFK